MLNNAWVIVRNLRKKKYFNVCFLSYIKLHKKIVRSVKNKFKFFDQILVCTTGQKKSGKRAGW